jgi:tRNA threonylcarbamoyladenosine biosynthesis protein TsaE
LTTSSERAFSSQSPQETREIGAELGRLLKGGETLLITGDLGAGKTVFIGGVARGLKIADPDSVHSPSYTLVNRYDGPIPLRHIDAYFMRSAEDLELCGYEDALFLGEAVAIEWADRIPDLSPAKAIRVHLSLAGLEQRKISIANWPA